MQYKKLEKTERYNGNANLKKEDIPIVYTENEIKEYKKCMDDIVYFARNYIKVSHVDKGLISFDLYDYQERLLKHYQDNRYSIVLSSRQSGKCVTGDTMVTIRDSIKPFKVQNNKISDVVSFLIKKTCDYHDTEKND